MGYRYRGREVKIIRENQRGINLLTNIVSANEIALTRLEGMVAR